MRHWPSTQFQDALGLLICLSLILKFSQKSLKIKCRGVDESPGFIVPSTLITELRIVPSILSATASGCYSRGGADKERMDGI